MAEKTEKFEWKDQDNKQKKLLGERGYILKFYQADSTDTPLFSLPGNF